MKFWLLILVSIISADSISQQLTVDVTIEGECLNINGYNTFVFKLTNISNESISVSRDGLLGRVSLVDDSLISVEPQKQIHFASSSEGNFILVNSKKSIELKIQSGLLQRYILDSNRRYYLKFGYSNFAKDKKRRRHTRTVVGEFVIGKVGFIVCEN